MGRDRGETKKSGESRIEATREDEGGDREDKQGRRGGGQTREENHERTETWEDKDMGAERHGRTREESEDDGGQKM